MVRTIRTFNMITPIENITVIDLYWSIVHSSGYYAIGETLFQNTYRGETYISQDGNYGEAHLIWDTDEMFQNWCSNLAIQNARAQHELNFLTTLKQLIETKRYVDPAYMAWNDPALAPDIFPMSEYVAPSQPLTFAWTFQVDQPQVDQP